MQTYINQIIASLYQPYDYESIQLEDVAKSLTATKVNPTGNETINANRPAARAIVTSENNSLRYRIDGTAATTSEGHLMLKEKELYLIGPDEISNFSAIRAGGTGTTSVIKVTYEH